MMSSGLGFSNVIQGTIWYPAMLQMPFKNSSKCYFFLLFIRGNFVIENHSGWNACPHWNACPQNWWIRLYVSIFRRVGHSDSVLWEVIQGGGMEAEIHIWPWIHFSKIELQTVIWFCGQWSWLVGQKLRVWPWKPHQVSIQVTNSDLVFWEGSDLGKAGE